MQSLVVFQRLPSFIEIRALCLQARRRRSIQQDVFQLRDNRVLLRRNRGELRVAALHAIEPRDQGRRL
jgi:hypothetical protein